jgi:hypothetical protein
MKYFTVTIIGQFEYWTTAVGLLLSLFSGYYSAIDNRNDRNIDIGLTKNYRLPSTLTYRLRIEFFNIPTREKGIKSIFDDIQ